MARLGGLAAGLCLMLALLAGCARQGPPAPLVTSSQGAAVVGAQPMQRRFVPHPDHILVQSGETLYGIARRYDVPVRTIIDANGLTPPFRLVAGRSLVLPQVRQHIVQPGDTILSVARLYGVDASTLTRTNELAPPYVIRVGQSLVLPAPVQVDAPATPPAAQTASLPPPAAPYGGASSYGASVPIDGVALGPPTPIVAAPPAPSAASPDIIPLDRAVPSAPAAAPSAVPAAVVEGKPSPAEPRASATSPPMPRALPAAREAREAPPRGLPPDASTPRASTPRASAPPAEPPRPEPPRSEPSRVETPRAETPGAETPRGEPGRPAETAALPPPPPRGGRSFLWPIQGRILSNFGPGANGTQNDGINIAAPEGTPVLAAEAGVVAYAGNELRGFGNLILLKHAQGYMTAYAHNKELLVKRGDNVRRGQPIARVGDTGIVGEPQLHFELRRGARALDPADYLTPLSTASQ